MGQDFRRERALLCQKENGVVGRKRRRVQLRQRTVRRQGLIAKSKTRREIFVIQRPNKKVRLAPLQRFRPAKECGVVGMVRLDEILFPDHMAQFVQIV